MGFQIAALIIAAYGANEQRRSAAAQRKAVKRERRIAEVENVRSRRQAIRERLIQAEQLRNQGAVSGTMESSGVQGGIASIGSQTASNIGFSNQIDQLNQQRLSFLDAANQYQSNAGIASTVASSVNSISS